MKREISASLRGRAGIDRPIRVLHCPADVGGNPQNLARMERELGAESISVVRRPNKFQYQSDRILFGPEDGFFRRELGTWRYCVSEMQHFDIVHYNYGQPLMACVSDEVRIWPPAQAARRFLVQPYRALFEFADVAFLKRTGKGIVVTYQGDDARQGDYCLENHDITIAKEVDGDYYTARSDARKRRQIARFRRYADRIYALNPDLLNVLPLAEFVPYAHVVPSQSRPHYPAPRARPRVLHAPSHRGVKGTRFVLEAAERLRREGVPFDLELIENLPNAEALQRYREADLVVDQLLAGWYGGFAVEAMVLGKPVIAYLRESDLHVLPREMREELPVIDANPETIYDVLREWLTVRRHVLPERGRAARAYVERWHDARAIARRLIRDYEAVLREREAGGGVQHSRARN